MENFSQEIVSTPSTHEKVTIYSGKSQWKKALQDILESFEKWQIWFLLGYQDIKLRYRRSVLGPFWITLSMAITVASMGYLYSHLFHMDVQTYFPYLTAGMLSWYLISGIISELTDGFITSEGMIKQIRLPYCLYIHRLVWRNFLIFFHNVLVMFPIILIFHKSAKIDFNLLLLIPNLLLVYIAGFTCGNILALIGARYRDISQVIKNLVQVIFFITPIMWSPAILPQRVRSIADYNPFFGFVELIREPLLGAQPSLQIYAMCFTVLIFSTALFLFLFSKYRARIIYWL